MKIKSPPCEKEGADCRKSGLSVRKEPKHSLPCLKGGGPTLALVEGYKTSQQTNYPLENVDFPRDFLTLGENALYRTFVRLREHFHPISLIFRKSVSVSIGLSTR